MLSILFENTKEGCMIRRNFLISFLFLFACSTILAHSTDQEILREIETNDQPAQISRDFRISNFPWLEEFTSFLPSEWSEAEGMLADPTSFTSTSASAWTQDGFGNVGTSGAARMNFYSNYSDDFDWLITPTLDLGDGTTNYKLEFDLALTLYSSNTATSLQDDDKFTVVISTDNGSTWSEANVLQMWDSSTAISNTGDHHTIDLSAYNGEVKLGFYAESTEFNVDSNIFIDNVEVKELSINPLFLVSPNSKDFGSMNLEVAEVQTFTISNDGVGSLGITSLALNGTDIDQFDINDANTYPVHLASMEEITFDITFQPHSAGSKSATVDITDDQGRTLHQVNLSGEGYDPYITLPYSQNFDSIAVPSLPAEWIELKSSTSTSLYAKSYNSASNSAPNCIKMYNSSYSTADLMLVTPPITDNIATTRIKFWAKSGYGNQNLIVGTLSDNEDEDTFTAVETVVINATYAEYTVNLTTAPSADQYVAFKHGMDGTYDSDYIDDVTWEVIPTNPVFAVTPESNDFGSVLQNGSSDPQTFSISNDGLGELEITFIALTGADADQFNLTGETTATLTAGESIDVDISFAPTSSGTKTASLEITDALSRDIHLVSLTGESQGANFNVSPTSKDYETVNLGGSSSQTFTISNSAGGNLGISTVNIAGTDVDQFQLTDANNYPITLANAEEITLDVSFLPTSEGNKSATLNITDDLGRTLNQIDLSGEGYDPSIASFPWLEEFNTFPPADWAESKGELTENATLTGTTSNWAEDGFGNVGTTGAARMNIYSTGRFEWFLTPVINLGDGSTNYNLEFDLALTPWTGTTPTDMGSDDKFAVVISTDAGSTWSSLNTLQLWDNTNPISNTGDEISISLAAYSGYVQLGFYAESTVSNTDISVYVDNVEISEISTTPLFAVTPQTKDFGTVLQDASSAPQIFSISNEAGGTLNITSIGLTGNDADQFSFTGETTATLTAGQSMDVEVSFSPASAGTKTAILEIADDLGRTAHEVTLTGESTGPEFVLTPASKDFGDVLVDAISSAQTFTISNNGGGNIEVSSLTITGIDAAEFQLTDTNSYPATLSNGQSITVDVAFAPASGGAKTASLDIVDNRGHSIGQTLQISRTRSSNRTSTSAALSGNGVGPEFALFPAAKDFADVLVDDISTVQTFTISNNGGGNIEVSSLTITGIDAAEFQLSDTNNYPVHLNNGQSISVDVNFAPTSAGAKTASLDITDNRGNFIMNSLLISKKKTNYRIDTSATLNGNGVGPEFIVYPTNKNFGIVDVGSSDSQTFTISNNGGSNLIISSISLSGANSDQYQLSNDNQLPVELSNNEAITVDVNFQPTMPGELSASLNISDSVGRVVNSVVISGVGYNSIISNFPWTEEFSSYLPADWSEAKGVAADPTNFTDTENSVWINDTFGNSGSNQCAKINIYGDTKADWLITPSINLGDGSEGYQLKFDLALTHWGNTNEDVFGESDKFMVVVSTDNGSTWNFSNSLRSWDNSTQISSTGEPIAIDLTSYTGIIKLGFYGEKSITGGDIDLFIDNVTICPAVGTGCGYCYDGTSTLVDVFELEVDGMTVDPDVILEPDNSEDYSIDVLVAGSPQGNSTPADAVDIDLSYLLTLEGNTAGVIWNFTLYYSGYSPQINYLRWFDGSTWQQAQDVTFGSDHVDFSIQTMSRSKARNSAIEILLGDDNPLPVTLTSFNAVSFQNETVSINWTTESESGLIGYKIYRSLSDIDHVDFISNHINPTNSSESHTYSYHDGEVVLNTTYYYWLEAIEIDGSAYFYGPLEIKLTQEEEESPELTQVTELLGNYPNPFNPATTIKFSVMEDEEAKLTIYNAKGQKIFVQKFLANTKGYNFQWDAKDQASGIYYYRLESPSFSQTKKMMLIK